MLARRLLRKQIDLPSVNDMKLFDAKDSANITTVGGAVTAWADMLGPGVIATPPTVAMRPTLANGGIDFNAQYMTFVGSKSTSWVRAMHYDGGSVVALVKPGVSTGVDMNGGLWGSTNVGYSNSVGAYFKYDSLGFQGAVLRGYTSSYTARAIYNNRQDICPYGVIQDISMVYDPRNSTTAQRMKVSINGAEDLLATTGGATATSANSYNDMGIGTTGGGGHLFVGSIYSIAFIPSVIDFDIRLAIVQWMRQRHIN